MASKRRKKRKPQNNLLVLKLLILVVVVLVVFEGKLVITMFSSGSGTETATTAQNDKTAASGQTTSKEGSSISDTSGQTSSGSGSATVGVGLGSVSGSKKPASVQTTSEEADTGAYSEALSSPAVVAKMDTSVDDSYFSDAVFIGDSRMEGFRNTSGITQGEFLTSVGMSLAGIADQKVNTSEGSITVYQGLSGRQYGKIYLMLGANDLGYYPWEDFLPHAEKVLEQFHQLQPGAIIYVCSCIYVEENKITTSYVNNENVIKVNNYLLQACEDLDYCYYVNLNEKFSDGYRELIPGASQDGVHLYPEYTQDMLAYLKSHYIYIAPAASEEEVETDAEV